MEGSRKSVHAAENKTRHQIIIGDARKMAELADESVHLVVTSPSYRQLKEGFLNYIRKEVSRLSCDE